MSSPVSPIAQAIAAGFKLLKTVMDTAESRKLRKAIEAGEKYIQVSEGTSPYTDLSNASRRKLLRRYKIRFFKYN